MREAASRFVIPVILMLAAGQAVAHGPEMYGTRMIPLTVMTEDVQFLFGHPDTVGEPFVMRIRELAGGVIPAHRHPVDEHITVLQGSVFFNVGEDCSRSAMTELKAGSYAFIPKGLTMCGYTPQAAVVQVHGLGPFHIKWRAGTGWRDRLKTLDSADAAEVFAFKRGDRVDSPLGRGVIRQGYDSGEVVGYEIDGENGQLFMAVEADVKAVKPAQ
jgi:quercetin dioxygenase-like cupin family protein